MIGVTNFAFPQGKGMYRFLIIKRLFENKTIFKQPLNEMRHSTHSGVSDELQHPFFVITND
jgi:hypothetical protein